MGQEVTSQDRLGWVATRRENMYILTEHSMSEKVFALNLDTEEFSIIRRGKKTVLGELIRVDLSPEALLEGLDIQEGDRLMVIMAGTRGRAVECSVGS